MSHNDVKYKSWINFHVTWTSGLLFDYDFLNALTHSPGEIKMLWHIVEHFIGKYEIY